MPHPVPKDNSMSEILVASPPLLTADLPGIGGVIKAEAEDFEVEEIGRASCRERV